MPLTQTPIIRVNCRPSVDDKLGNLTRPGVLISDDDVEMLRMLAGRGDLGVVLVCRRRPIYEGQVQVLLQRIAYLTGRGQWYLPTVATGPLMRPLPASLSKPALTSS